MRGELTPSPTRFLGFVEPLGELVEPLGELGVDFGGDIRFFSDLGFILEVG